MTCKQTGEHYPAKSRPGRNSLNLTENDVAIVDTLLILVSLLLQDSSDEEIGVKKEEYKVASAIGFKTLINGKTNKWIVPTENRLS